MNVGIVFSQMIILLLLMLTGYACARLHVVDEHGSKVVSSLIGNVFNPALIISSVLSNSKSGGDLHLKEAAILIVGMFLLFIVLGIGIGKLLSRKEEEQLGYRIMMVFSNMGFMGIPLIKALYGDGPLSYVAIAVLVYNFVYYSYGVLTMGKGQVRFFSRENLKRICNIGSFASVLTIFLLVYRIQLPYIAESAINYLANVATPLALMSVGLALGNADLRSFVKDGRMYLFALIKLVAVPVLFCLFFSRLSLPAELLGTLVILGSMPVGNMPVVLANQFGRDSEMMSRVILITTVLSVGTLPLVVWFYNML